MAIASISTKAPDGSAATSIVARLPLEMLSIGLLLHARHLTGSFAAAGVVEAAFAISLGIGAPLIGRAVDQSGQTLFVGSGVSALGGTLTNGTTQMVGTGALEGTFDRVAIGQTDGRCSGVSATLWQVAAKTLDAYCATRVDSTTRVQTLTSYATGGTMILANVASFLAVSGNANFSGDLLQMDRGAIQVDGAATFGGGRVLVTGGGITLRSTAQFSSASASYDTAKVLIEGDVTFAGTGVQKFNSGSLTLHGNFVQNDVGNGNFDAVVAGQSAADVERIGR